MTELLARMGLVNDEKEPSDPYKEIEVRVGTSTFVSNEGEDDIFKSVAPSDVTGLNPNFRRKTTRNLSKVFRGAEGATAKRIDPNDISGYSLFEVVLPPYNLDYLAKLYDISSPHMAACNAKAANIVGLGYDFVESPTTKMTLEGITNEVRVKNARKKLALGKQQLLEWLDSCNEEDTFEETLKNVWIDYETTGNGYFEIGRTATGKVGYIGHIPATTMRIRKARDGFVQIISNRAVFFKNFGEKSNTNPVGEGRPNEVIHIKKYSPSNSYYGTPDIIAAKNAVAGNEFASRYNLDYFENKAVPRYVIIVKGASLSTNAERRLLQFFQTGLKGQNHRSIYIPLPADTDTTKTSFEMKPVEASVQDSSFTNYDKSNLMSILMSHRTPLTKVGLAEGVSLAVARDADKTFKEQVCRPEQRILEKKLNRIIKQLTDAFLLKLTEMTLTDEDTQSKIDEREIRMQIKVPNEIRARQGHPGREGGDKPVDLKAQAASEQLAQAGNTRQRTQERSANSPDGSGEARQPKGAGRATA